VLELYAHSQGGIIADRVLARLTPEERAQINVTTFGSGKIIDSKGLRSCKNYVSSCDAVPFISDPIGCFKGLFSRNSNVTFIRSNNWPMIDHGFEDAYGEVFARTAIDFKKKYGVIK